MNDDQEFDEIDGPSQGFKQILAVVLLSGAVVILGAVFVIQRELGNHKEAMKWTVAEFGLGAPTVNRLSPGFQDQDNNLVADAPADPEEFLTPDKLVFSFIAGADLGGDAETWLPLTDAIAEATGIEVEFREYDTIEQQMMEMRTGTLHVTSINTGAVPRAVNTCGFVPVSTLGTANGEFGVTTKVLVPTTSKVKKLSDLRGRRIMFTSLSSNSGFKAPLVILNDDFGMEPSIDYNYGFSTSHVQSIELIRSKSVEAAPLASDMLDRAIADGVISEDDFRVIYESEKFPPAAFGYVHLLDPQIAEKIRETIVGFELTDTVLGQSLHAEQLVQIDYKNDWALIRRIDNALGVVHTAAEPATLAQRSTIPIETDEIDDDENTAGLEQGDQSVEQVAVMVPAEESSTDSETETKTSMEVQVPDEESNIDDGGSASEMTPGEMTPDPITPDPITPEEPAVLDGSVTPEPIISEPILPDSVVAEPVGVR